jgi:hypothetical protein
MRPALSALIIGALERLLDDTQALARDQDNPHFEHQAHALVRRARAEAASVRLLAHHAAAPSDRGQGSTVLSSIAKSAVAQLARDCASEALRAIGDAAGAAAMF